MTQWFRKPNSFVTLHTDYSSDAETLQSAASSTNIHSLMFGNGCAIYQNSILPAISSAETEVIIVTCFFARSPTRDYLNDTLRELSAKCVRSKTRIRVRINFSSSSLFQKLFHTTSLKGRTYRPSEWPPQLGLPDQSELPGLDLEVKSIFILPFSVIHPKFIIIDRSTVFLPSCNISWENWFEGSLQLSGPVTEQFVNFWRRFWASDMDRELLDVCPKTHVQTETFWTQDPRLLSSRILQMSDIECLFLPSPHHRNPRFAMPWQQCPQPPQTPLNMFLLSAFADARENIYIQTPNLTSPPVLSALLSALKRGIDVTIVTSDGLMILEQILTAGTTTRRCVKKLTKRHKQLINQLELAPGALTVKYYHRDPQASKNASDPVQSHLKLTIIDAEITILGSGNMDRASWYTSQELGLCLKDKDFAATARAQVDVLMQQRTQ